MNMAFPKTRQISIPGNAFVVSDDSFPRKLGDLHKNDKWRKEVILWVTGLSHLRRLATVFLALECIF